MNKTTVTKISGIAGKLLHFKKNEITISLLFPCRSSFNEHEIYCPELFDDVERYNELSEALERVFELNDLIK